MNKFLWVVVYFMCGVFSSRIAVYVVLNKWILRGFSEIYLASIMVSLLAGYVFGGERLVVNIRALVSIMLICFVFSGFYVVALIGI